MEGINVHRFAVVDIEATGAKIGAGEEIIQIACIIIENGRIVHTFDTLVNPDKMITPYITELTGISNEDLKDAPYFDEIAPLIYSLLQDSIFVAHNVAFDYYFLSEHFERLGYPPLDMPSMDTVELTQILFPTLPSYHLADICQSLSIPLRRAHDALSDVQATADLWFRLVDKGRSLPTHTLSQLIYYGKYLINQTGQFFTFCQDLKEEEQELSDEYIIIDDLLIRQPQKYDNHQGEEKRLPYEELKSSFLKNYTYRPGQIKMMDCAHQYLSDDESSSSQLVIEATAGIGKTLGYLLPAISDRENHPIIISTYTKHLQKQLIDEALPLLKKILDYPVRICLMKSLKHYLSLSRLASLKKTIRPNQSESFSLMQILVWLTQTQTGDLDEINRGKYAQNSLWDQISIVPGEMVLPQWQGYDFAHQRAIRLEQADVIITNHAYFCHHLFDLKDSFKKMVVIFDEAHHLPAMIYRQLYFSYSLKDWQNLLGDLTEHINIKQSLDSLMLSDSLIIHSPFQSAELVSKTEILLEMIAVFEVLLKENYLPSQNEQWQGKINEWPLTIKKLVKQIISIQSQVIDCLKEGADHYRRNVQTDWTIEDLSFIDQLNEILKQLTLINQSLNILMQKREMTTLYLSYTKEEQNIYLKLYENSFKHDWHKQFQSLNPVIYTSGSLTVDGRIDYFSKLIGIKELKLEIIDSNYDYSKQTQIIIPDRGIDPKKKSKKSLIKFTADWVEAVAGNATYQIIIAQNSREDVQLLAEALSAREALTHYSIFDQCSGQHPEKMIHLFEQTPSGILIGTIDFFEGVDLPRQALDLIILPRLPFESPDQIDVQQRQALARISQDQVFECDLLPQMIFKLRQMFGRLVRCEDDCGVLIILDERFWRAKYSHIIHRALPDNLKILSTSLDQITEQLALFFKNDQRKTSDH